MIDNLEHLRGAPSLIRLSSRADLRVYGALETRRAGESYDWRGLQRGAEASHPWALFQYTIDGWGEYSEPGIAPVRVDSGKAFCVVIPSDHRYRLPPESDGWTFLWVMSSHRYVASRIADVRRALPAVIPVAADSALAGRLVRLIEAARGEARDATAVESAIFGFYFEYERHAATLLHPEAARERLLAEIRDEVRASLSHRPDVDALAGRRGMSRSHFSHHFKAVTGLAPARYMTLVRLEEAADRLTDPEVTLEALAAQTGFANANHFCKVFRRHFHISPGEYRRQMQATRSR